MPPLPPLLELVNDAHQHGLQFLERGATQGRGLDVGAEIGGHLLGRLDLGPSVQRIVYPAQAGEGGRAVGPKARPTSPIPQLHGEKDGGQCSRISRFGNHVPAVGSIAC